jgi:hypothetical protein
MRRFSFTLVVVSLTALFASGLQSVSVAGVTCTIDGSGGRRGDHRDRGVAT